MIQTINKIADKLTKAGLNPNTPIALLSENSIEMAAMIIACLKANLIACPLSLRYPASKIVSALKTINCTNLITSMQYATCITDVDTYLIDEFLTSPPAVFTGLTYDNLNLNLQNDATMIFTSASTADPKACLHAIENHYYSAQGSNENIPFNADDNWLINLPLYHISGLSIIFRALLHGSTVTFANPEKLLAQNITDNNITHLSLVPTQLQKLLTDQTNIPPLQSLKALLIGGSAIPTSLIQAALANNIPIHTTYGSTEAASQLTTTAKNQASTLTSGQPLPHRQIKIAPDSEILIKGKTLFKGYIEDGQLDPARDDAGFYHTGDTGKLDPNGNLIVTGRKDLMFISGAENIHPEEIEAALLNIPQITQAVVVPTPHKTFGQTPTAFIKTNNNINPAEIANQLSKTLEPYKIPKTFHPMPKETQENLKPNRQKLTNQANQQIS